MGVFDRAQAALVRVKKLAEGRTITYTRKAVSYTLTGWFGRGIEVNDIQTGARFAISEREYFLTVEDMETAGLGEPKYGDRLQVSGEDEIYEVLDPKTMGEKAWKHSDSERTFWRIHTTLVKVT